MSKVQGLKKQFTERDVNRMRNLIQGKHGDKVGQSVGYSKSEKQYKEGDIWEADGRKWTIKNGLKQNITKLDAAKKAIRVPLKCPKCGGSMKHWLNKKMYKIHGFCFYFCTVEFEHELKEAGLYDQYEKRMMDGSMKAFSKDIEQWTYEFIEQESNFVTEQGEIETWKSSDSKFRERILTNLKGYLKELNKRIT